MTINRKRMTAIILTALIVFVVLLSACAVVMEATHSCSGEDCGVCRILGMINGVIRSLTVTIVVLFVVTADGLRRFFHQLLPPKEHRGTPVTEKVRLLN